MPQFRNMPSPKVPQTKPGSSKGKRGSKKNISFQPAKGQSGNRAPTLGEQVPRTRPGPR